MADCQQAYRYFDNVPASPSDYQTDSDSSGYNCYTNQYLLYACLF